MILTVTFNPTVDQTVRVEERMVPDRVLRTTHARFDAGGKGINVSRYLVGQGVDTLATGLVGGFTGEFVTDDLAADGVPTDFVTVDGTTRVNNTIVAGDEEYKVNQSGPRVEPGCVDDVIERIRARDPDRVLVSGSLPPGLDVGAIDRVARGGDWLTSVDVQGYLLRGLSAEYELCKPNRWELGDATGLDVSTREGAAEAACQLREWGFESVIASLDADGALLADESGVRFAPALDVEPVDSVGAGDALLAGVLAAYDGGADADAALRRGVAVASRVVENSGPGVTEFERVRERSKTVDVSPIDLSVDGSPI